MPINTKYIESFQENEFMHVICRAVGLNVLFRNDDNKSWFIKQYIHYLSPYVDTYCYCLLDNHVHWLIKCKSALSLSRYINSIVQKDRKKHQQDYIENRISFEQAVEFQYKDFFISYAKAFNKKYNRYGALFVNPFRRINVKDRNHLIQLVVYIHANPIKHKLTSAIKTNEFVSFQSLLSSNDTWLMKEEVLGWFGGKESYLDIHYKMAAYYYGNKYAME